MRKLIGSLADTGSVILAAGLLIYFIGFPGHKPSSETWTYVSFGIVIFCAVIYIGLEALTVLRSDTVTPLYFAFETEISHLPMYAFCVIGTLWWNGDIVISPFQWVTAGLFLAVVAFDLLGFVTVLSRYYLLTDELKNVK